MKKLYGITSNINKNIVGKITRQPVRRWDKDDYIFITTNEKNNSGYATIILDKSFTDANKKSLVHSVNNLEYLKDGDLVLVEPNGTINVLYEKESSHNSLLITGRCNCSCIMCPQPKVVTEEDKKAFNLKLISLMSGDTKCLGLTGGEPTLIGDALFDIIDACKKRLPKTAINLLTNAIKFEDFEYAKKLAIVQHPDLLVDIPLYSDTDTEHNKIIGANGFYKTIKGIYNLALFEQKVGIRVVIHRLTYQRLLQLAEFIYHNFPFLFHVAFMQMETMGLAEQNIESLWIDPFDYNSQLEKAANYLSRRDINVSIYNAQLCVLPKTLWQYARKSISTWKNIYLEECNNCDYHNICGGFFESSLTKHSNYISPIRFSNNNYRNGSISLPKI